MNLFRLLIALRGLLRFPDIGDEAALRSFLRSAADAAGKLAAVTPVVVDDLAVRAALAVLDNDELWAAFYALLRFSGGEREIDILMQTAGVDSQVILSWRDAIHEAMAADIHDRDSMV